MVGKDAILFILNFAPFCRAPRSVCGALCLCLHVCACSHMTCRTCTHQFCWVCLGPYKGRYTMNINSKCPCGR